MNEPLSFTNPNVKTLRRLLGRRSARTQEGRFVVEGATLLAEAVASGHRVVAEFVAPGGSAVTSGTVHQLADGVLGRVADTRSPQPNLAIVETPDPIIDLDAADFILVADRINDPGNLGTMLRSAEAAGVDAVVVTPGTVDPYNPKVVRASAGAVFHVPLAPVDLATVARSGFVLVGTSSHGGIRHSELDWTRRVGIIMGSEAHGLDRESGVDEWARIEHAGRAESLNVAMAATLLVFEAARQRRTAP